MMGVETGNKKKEVNESLIFWGIGDPQRHKLSDLK